MICLSKLTRDLLSVEVDLIYLLETLANGSALLFPFYLQCSLSHRWAKQLGHIFHKCCTVCVDAVNCNVEYVGFDQYE